MNFFYYFICALLAFVGGAFSFYFNGVYKGTLEPNQAWVPNRCQIDNNRCTAIVDTKYGRILGLPNSQLGGYFLFIYTLTLIGVPLGMLNPLIPLYIGAFTILLAIYLVFGLFKLKTGCPICLTVHSLNTVIFILQLIIY